MPFVVLQGSMMVIWRHGFDSIHATGYDLSTRRRLSAYEVCRERVQVLPFVGKPVEN